MISTNENHWLIGLGLVRQKPSISPSFKPAFNYRPRRSDELVAKDKIETLNLLKKGMGNPELIRKLQRSGRLRFDCGEKLSYNSCASYVNKLRLEFAIPADESIASGVTRLYKAGLSRREIELELGFTTEQVYFVYRTSGFKTNDFRFKRDTV